MATFADLLRVGRPHFLLAGFAFLALGGALAWRAGAPIDPMALAMAAAFTLATQWGVHYGNEAHDVEADRANAARTRLAGGTGLVASGRVPRRDALGLSRFLFALASLAAAGLAAVSPASLALTAPAFVLAWGYSAPPLRLCARGLGEAATGLVVALFVPALVLVPAGVPVQEWWPLAPLVPQVAALVLALDLPDAPGDALAGKRTLAVRLGPRASRRVLQATWLTCGLASTAAVGWGAPPTFALAGGAAVAASVALPVLVLRRWWDTLSLAAMAIAGLQWALTLGWALA